MNLSHQRQGEVMIFGGALLWSIFPIITVLTFNKLPALISLSLSSFLAAVFFAVIITKRKLWHEVKNSAALKNILLGTLFIGLLYYILIFLGLQYTSPGNTSIICLTEVLFSFLFFHVLRKDHIPKSHIFGALLMIVGALIILSSSFKTFHVGDILILTANIFAPLGNFFQQKARKQVSSETIIFVRNLLSSPIIFLIALIFHVSISLHAIQNSLPFLLINGLLLLGFTKILWLEAIHRISITKAAALSSIDPFFTMFFAFLVLNQTPTIYQILAIIPIIPGVILLSRQTKPAVVMPEEN